MRPKLSGVSKEDENGVVTKKGEQVWGKSRVNEGYIYFISLIVDTTYHYYHWIIPSLITAIKNVCSLMFVSESTYM